MKPLIHGAVGRSALKRASTIWWTIMGLVSLLLAGSVASDSHPVELMAWLGDSPALPSLFSCAYGDFTE